MCRDRGELICLRCVFSEVSDGLFKCSTRSYGTIVSQTAQYPWSKFNFSKIQQSLAVHLTIKEISPCLLLLQVKVKRIIFEDVGVGVGFVEDIVMSPA